MEPKKIIIGITAEGSVNLLLGQLAFYKSRGYKTYLLAPYSERSAAFCKNEGCAHLVITIEREISLVKDLKTLWVIVRVFRKINPDIINLGTPKVSLLGMIAAFITGVPKRIYTCRGFRFEHEVGMKRRILIVMERITSFFAHKVICISNSVEILGIKNRIFAESKTIVISKGSSNGVNLSLFNPNEEIYHKVKRELQQKYDLANKLVFGFLGRIVDRKGINELYDVFSEMYMKDTSARMLLIGPFEVSQIADKSLIEKIDSHPGIINYGRVKQEDVPGFMLAMDVFVLPAWWEGFGNVLVQAAAMGIPVISTTGTGTVDAVHDGYNGILVPVKDKEMLLEAMSSLSSDRVLRHKLGHNGLTWSKNFDRNIIWEELHNIYQS